MWALPDIVQMNSIAVDNQKRFAREARLKTSRKYPCEGCGEPSIHHLKYYDIFSEDVKGVTHLCEDHYGADCNGFFYCDSCKRRMAENYSWEIYGVQLGDRTLCLKCAAEEHFSNAANWIDPRAVKNVIQKPRRAALFNPATGALNIARCLHVLAVEQPVPDAVKFVDNFEFDSMDGHQISGGDMLETIKGLSVPFCPVHDAAYQFAVSIGLYVRAGRGAFDGLFTKAGDNRVLPVTFSKRYNTPRWAGIALDPGWEKGVLQIEGNPLVQVPVALEEAAQILQINTKQNLWEIEQLSPLTKTRRPKVSEFTCIGMEARRACWHSWRPRTS